MHVERACVLLKEIIIGEFTSATLHGYTDDNSFIEVTAVMTDSKRQRIINLALSRGMKVSERENTLMIS